MHLSATRKLSRSVVVAKELQGMAVLAIWYQRVLVSTNPLTRQERHRSTCPLTNNTFLDYVSYTLDDSRSACNTRPGHLVCGRCVIEARGPSKAHECDITTEWSSPI